MGGDWELGQGRGLVILYWRVSVSLTHPTLLPKLNGGGEKEEFD